MRQFLRLVFGLRPDLPLSEKWWYRLAKVVFILGATVTGLIAMTLLVSANQSEPSEDHVTILTSLRDFAKQADPGERNVIPAFLQSPGKLGGRKDGTLQFVSTYSVGKSICSADLERHVAFSVDEDARDEYRTLTPADRERDIKLLTEALKEEEANRKPGEDKRYCTIDNGVGFSSDQIVKYEFTNLGLASVWTLSLLETVGALLATSLIILNVYYRGFVYIVCGPRKTATPPPAA